MKAKVNVTYTISYTQEVELEFTDELYEIFQDEGLLEGSDIDEMYELNSEIFDIMEGGEYVVNSFEINNINNIF